jgi:hypothetical protein
MAKKEKKKKDKQGSGTTDPVEAVRSAVERTFKATSEGAGGAQKRGRDLVEEVAHAAARFREAMGDLKVLDDLKSEVESLRARVAALEGKATTAARPRSTATTSRSRSATKPSAKPATSRGKTTGTTSRAPSGTSRAKTSGTARTRSTTAKSSAAKPASTRSRSTRSSGSSS